MYRIILIRHGESVWNKRNIFTGWTDVSLTKKGVRQAMKAADVLLRNDLGFDFAFCSFLKKSIRTLWIICRKMDLCWVKIEKSWRLNERHYGALQGLNKKRMARLVGKKQVFKWRRGYEDRPPELKNSNFPSGQEEKFYRYMDDDDIPKSESLKDVVGRVAPYWEERIIPEVRNGRKVIVSSHGNCLRALVKYIQHIGDEDIEKIDLPYASPMVYYLDKRFNYKNHVILKR